MGARQSSEVKYAIYLHRKEGKSRGEAAIMAGIAPSTLYRALTEKQKKKRRK